MLAEGRTPLASSPLGGVGGQLREKRNAKILWRRFVDKMLDISMEQAATQGNPPVQPFNLGAMTICSTNSQR